MLKWRNSMSQWLLSCSSEGSALMCDGPLPDKCYIDDILGAVNKKMFGRSLSVLLIERKPIMLLIAHSVALETDSEHVRTPAGVWQGA